MEIYTHITSNIHSNSFIRRHKLWAERHLLLVLNLHVTQQNWEFLHFMLKIRNNQSFIFQVLKVLEKLDYFQSFGVLIFREILIFKPPKPSST